MNKSAVPPVYDLLLVGGGHSHVHVLRSFGMAPIAGVRITVLAREVHTPYSGMLPGYIAGWHQWDDIHIDLGQLCRFAGARLIHDEAVALDLEQNRVHCQGRPPLRFDLLSINSGAQPVAIEAQPTCGEAQSLSSEVQPLSIEAQPSPPVALGVPVKPIGRFLPEWEAMRRNLGPRGRLVYVGAGAGGMELALAARRSLPKGVCISIVAEEVLPGHSGAARKLLKAALAKADIELIAGLVNGVAPGALHFQDSAGAQSRLAFDHLFWTTGVQAPAWVRDSALTTDAQGFIRVDKTLGSVSHEQVFAAGDIVHFSDRQLPKSGVYAVRAGPVLTDNLRRQLQGRRLRNFRPQRFALSLISVGDGRAVASWGMLAAVGRWAWRWKLWIDRRFVARYQELPEMAANAPQSGPRRKLMNLQLASAQERRGTTKAGVSTNPSPLSSHLATSAQDALNPMRCGGCGAKLSADVLQRALARLPDQAANGVVQGIGDDAAVLESNPAPLVLTIDGFRSLVDDPYRFGRITAHHCLNDVYAMGAEPTSAMALATVPLMSAPMMEDELHQLLAGAVAVLNGLGVPLVGGHSAEGAELSLGLSITGALVDPVLAKGGARLGDRLILTKPLGVGVLFAAHMRGLVRTAEVENALAHMDQSNCLALSVLRQHEVGAATDVTGFGLIGHLAEMLDAAGLGAQVWLDRLSVLDGVLAALERGAASVMQVENEKFFSSFEIRNHSPAHARVKLLADPQTAGGLLACVPEARAGACQQALLAAGYDSAEIGLITAEERLIC